MKKTLKRTIGDTTYIVENIFASGKVSAYDKVKKLILNDSGEKAKPCAGPPEKKPRYDVAS